MSSLQFYLLFLLCLLSLISSISSLDNKTPISLSLHQFNQNPSPNPWQNLAYLASTSLIRAQHLKNPKPNPNPLLTKSPLFSHAYGGYSISLNFGTPPQKISLLLDTGSDLVWLPCTKNYACKNCTFSNTKTQILPFLPRSSSSSKLIGCKNPKCTWIHTPEFLSNCQNCPPNSTACSQVCPPYAIIYGSGSTAGLLLSETLTFPEKIVSDFGVGCSLFSSNQPAGIAGFGRGPPSLPSQLGLKTFSYCLLSRRFDDTNESSSLILNGGSDSDEKDISYSPFLKNPVAGRSVFSTYYYVQLRKITVGGTRVKIPYHFLWPGSNGNGGTIIDSGTTFTFMVGPVFEQVAREFEMQVRHYKRAYDVETKTGLRPCFNISAEKSVSLPELSFHFKGGAIMSLPLANYFSILGNSDAVCLTVVADGRSGTEISGGPSIIFGNFQQQNYYIEYDLENERLGFRKQTC
ncbi:eukaryotic aspartyl protease family protein [Tasmannia lanceolata]|uniref:eukaryotic aspartyl protease family protein n=1 Tax=Tasmannia lanceolata TaxID=3420 RepID=UPI0040629F57